MASGTAAAAHNIISGVGPATSRRSPADLSRGADALFASPAAPQTAPTAGSNQAQARANHGIAPTQGGGAPEESASSGAVAIPSAPTDGAGAAAAYGQRPLSFEANLGQVDPRVRFLSRGGAGTLFFTPTEVVLDLPVPGDAGAAAAGGADGVVLRMGLVGANAAPQFVVGGELPGKVNAIQGDSPAGWITDIPTYARIEERGVYEGIDLVYYGNGRRLEYDFIVAPGADPSTIRLSFRGNEGAAIDPTGNLVLHTAVGDVVEHAPVLYQTLAGFRQAVEGGYVLAGDQVGFWVGAYDRSQPLVIDPVLSYSTYLGGNGFDQAYGIAVDGSGNAYVAGRADTTNFPTTAGAYQTTNTPSTTAAFVTKLDPNGRMVYSTYLAGAIANDIALDASGNAYITGTAGLNFPTTPVAFMTSPFMGSDAFVTKLNPTGSALVYSTYFGGDWDDEANGIAVDSGGNAIVTGTTRIRGPYNFPIVNAFQPTYGGGNNDAFVFKLNAAGSGLVYSTFLGGGGVLNTTDDWGEGVALDASGNAYVSGMTFSQDFPTTPGAFDRSGVGGLDNFVTKFTPTGAVAYSTFLGSDSGHEENFGGIAVDSGGNAYITGYTDAWNDPSTAVNEGFPTTPGAFQPNLVGQWDAFVTKLNPTGSGLVYSTYLGGSDPGFGGAGAGTDRGWDIAVDSSGFAYVTGDTGSTNFPTLGAVQATYGDGFHDAFVTKVNPDGRSIAFSTYLGGNLDDQGMGIAVDASGNAYVAGVTDSFNFPTTAGALQTANGGGLEHHDDGFVARITGTGTTAVALATLTLNPTIVTGGATAQGTVTLNGVAPTGGAVVSLTSGQSTFAAVPASVTVPAGATTATFTINTHTAWSGSASSTITASYGGVTRSAFLRIDPDPNDVSISTLSFTPSSVNGGNSATGTVTLTGPALAGGAIVALSSGNPSIVGVPQTVLIAQGATSATFTATTANVTTSTAVNLSATYGNGATAFGALTVNSAATSVVLAGLSLSPTSVTGGSASTGTVTLSGAAPAGGIVVSLSSSNTGAATVPTSVTVPAGTTKATFSITTRAVSGSTSVTISAAQGGVTRTAALTVNPSTPADTVNVTRAEYTASKQRLRVEATSTSSAAVLKVYVTSTGALIGTLTNNGGGRFSGQFSWPTNPRNITVRSSLGGSASRTVALK